MVINTATTSDQQPELFNIPMEKKSDDIRYSEPVTEIMGRPPGKLLRHGTVIILLVIILLFFFLWLIRYPDNIPAPVEITTRNPPVTLVSKVAGRIRNLDVNDNDPVRSGQILAVMESTASVSEILKIRRLTDTIYDPSRAVSLTEVMPGYNQLGEIQAYWALFVKQLTDYDNYLQNDYYGKKAESLLQEVKGMETFLSRLKVKEALFSENLELGRKKFRRDSLLYIEGVFSESDFERSRQDLIRLSIELQQVRLDHATAFIGLAEKRQLLQDYVIKRVEERERYYSLLNEAFLNLKAQLVLWENTYTLVSPFNGRVSFTRFWSENQTVGLNDPVLTVIPEDTGEFVGRIKLKMNRSGKVRTGQAVNIKLSGFPFLEFGMVRGVVISKSLVPEGDSYVIEVGLPEGLTTLYGKTLEFNQNMQGTAEIITDSTRLLEKLTNPLRHLAARNRI